VPVKTESGGIEMSFLIVDAKDFDKNPAEYRRQARTTNVVVVSNGGFIVLSKMEPAGEAELINAGIKAMYDAGELSMEGHGVPVEELEEQLRLEELRGHAT
jgi:hypothetical protein